MVNTLWLVKKRDIPYSYIGKSDIVVLIEDAVLKVPTKPNWFLCKEDVKARNLNVSEDKLLTYREIAKLILKSKKVVVW